MNALFVGIRKTSANFIGAPSIERGHTQCKDIRIGLLRGNLGNSQLLPDQVDFFRLGATAANHANFYATARGTIEQVQGLAYGHVSRRESPDRLEYIAAAYAGLFRRAFR